MATQKQKKAVERTLENGGNVTQGMRDAKYKETTVNNPKNLTESKGWKELMKEYLPDKDLAKVHKDGLRAMQKKHQIIDRDEEGKPIYDFVDIDDFSTRHKYLDSAYKLKGHYATDKLDIDIKSGGDKLTKQGGIFKKAIKTGLRGRGHS